MAISLSQNNDQGNKPVQETDPETVDIWGTSCEQFPPQIFDSGYLS